MVLKKVKIGELVTIYNKINTEDLNYPFFGININKEFMPSVADTSNVDRKKYKIVHKGIFVFSGMQTGRDNCIRISLYNDHNTVLVSPAYTTFKVTSDEILPEYLFMFFRSKEKDRYGAFLSDASVRANLDWKVFCNIELEIPPIEIQKKYVDIYEALLDNLQSYEKGLDDLKLICDGYIEELRKSQKCNLTNLLKESFEKNTLNIASKEMGVSIQKLFIETKSQSSDITSQKIVKTNQFAFNSNTSRNSDTLSIALNKSNDIYAVSNTYIVFSVDEAKIYPEYLYLWFKRREFDRYCRFHSWGSARETITLDKIMDYEIAIPSLEKQKAIIEILRTYEERKQYIQLLKEKIQNICPILISGSIKEARGE